MTAHFVRTWDSEGTLMALLRRAALVATQLLGVALGRYVLHLPPIVEMDPEEIVAWVAPTIDRYLTAESAQPDQKPRRVGLL
ncbi:MAG: hypothetical protein M3306_07210 [Actinomycetota bacterium]|nr:hypothetical protein [Actinomycetota bacterium]